MGSLLRCSSALRGNQSASSLRSRHNSLDTRHGGIPRPTPPPCCAPVTPSAKERNLLYCVAATAPAIPAQRAASAPLSMFLTPALPSPFDAALSSGASPSGGLAAINGAGPPARTRSGPAAPPPARAACAWPRRRRRAGAGARAGLPVIALFVLLAAGLALGVLVGQHLAGGGGGGGDGAILGASPSRLAAGLVAAVSAGGRAVHRRVLAGGGDRVRPELGHAPAEQPGAARTPLPPARAAHVSLEGEAGLGARSALAGGQPAGGAEQPGRAAGAGAAAGAAARGFWEGSRQTAEWRAATSEQREQRAADQDLQQQARAGRLARVSSPRRTGQVLGLRPFCGTSRT